MKQREVQKRVQEDVQRQGEMEGLGLCLSGENVT